MKKQFRTEISKCSIGVASIKNNSTAQIVHLEISNEAYNDDQPYQLALDYDQLNDLINLMREISK